MPVRCRRESAGPTVNLLAVRKLCQPSVLM
jgi:hypothetical protein